MSCAELVGTSAAELIRRKRMEKDLSARSLSLAAHVSPSYVRKVEAGEIEPSLRQFARLARALGMNRYEIWNVVMAEAMRP